MIYEGKLNGSGLKIGIVAARFNEFIVSKLVSGAEDCLYRHDVAKEDVEVAWVPGAFEIPLVAQAMARTKKYDAIICLGCDENMPVMFGVVTTENIEQAIERAGTKAGNKGYDCAMGALEMVSLLKGIK